MPEVKERSSFINRLSVSSSFLQYVIIIAYLITITVVVAESTEQTRTLPLYVSSIFIKSDPLHFQVIRNERLDRTQ